MVRKHEEKIHPVWSNVLKEQKENFEDNIKANFLN
jgi:hypothetical protein